MTTKVIKDQAGKEFWDGLPACFHHISVASGKSRKFTGQIPVEEECTTEGKCYS